MKKSILTFAFIASLFAFNLNAQNSTPQKPECCQPEASCCTPNAECCASKVKPSHKVASKFNAFEGITLTSEQQTAVANLKEKFNKERDEAKKERNKDAKKGAQEAKSARKEYVKELKKILTPEQYTTYLENMVFNKPQGSVKSMNKVAKFKANDKAKRKDIKKGDKKAKAEKSPAK